MPFDPGIFGVLLAQRILTIISAAVQTLAMAAPASGKNNSTQSLMHSGCTQVHENDLRLPIYASGSVSESQSVSIPTPMVPGQGVFSEWRPRRKQRTRRDPQPGPGGRGPCVEPLLFTLSELRIVAGGRLAFSPEYVQS
jgi:hypothetical protein